MHIVAKPFNTTTRRFALNAEVKDTDDLSPHSLAELKARGFVVDKAASRPAPSTTSFGKRPVARRDPE